MRGGIKEARFSVSPVSGRCSSLKTGKVLCESVTKLYPPALFVFQLFPGLQARQSGNLSEEVLTWKRLGVSVEEEKEIAVFLILKCETGE